MRRNLTSLAVLAITVAGCSQSNSPSASANNDVAGVWHGVRTELAIAPEQHCVSQTTQPSLPLQMEVTFRISQSGDQVAMAIARLPTGAISGFSGNVSDERVRLTSEGGTCARRTATTCGVDLDVCPVTAVYEGRVQGDRFAGTWFTVEETARSDSNIPGGNLTRSGTFDVSR